MSSVGMGTVCSARKTMMKLGPWMSRDYVCGLKCMLPRRIAHCMRYSIGMLNAARDRQRVWIEDDRAGT